jgi:hypothetical protein
VRPSKENSSPFGCLSNIEKRKDEKRSLDVVWNIRNIGEAFTGLLAGDIEDELLDMYDPCDFFSEDYRT